MLGNISRYASKVLLFNASPRSANTLKLLKEAKKGAESVGSEAKIVDLFKLKYKGCYSCLECKKIGKPGGCVIKDQLSPYLKEIYDCNGIAIGSPIYMGNFTSSFYSFFERLIYSNMRYEVGDRMIKFGKKINTGMFITMGAPQEALQPYLEHLNHNIGTLSDFLGPCTVVSNVSQILTPDTKPYEMGMFDMERTNKWVKEHDPEVLKQAFDLGVKLATNKPQ